MGLWEGCSFPWEGLCGGALFPYGSVYGVLPLLHGAMSVLPLLGGAVGCGLSTPSHLTFLSTAVHMLSLKHSRETWVDNPQSEESTAGGCASSMGCYLPCQFMMWTQAGLFLVALVSSMLEPGANGWKSIGVLYGGSLDWSDHSVKGTPHNAHLTFLTPCNR